MKKDNLLIIGKDQKSDLSDLWRMRNNMNRMSLSDTDINKRKHKKQINALESPNAMLESLLRQREKRIQRRKSNLYNWAPLDTGIAKEPEVEYTSAIRVQHQLRIGSSVTSNSNLRRSGSLSD